MNSFRYRSLLICFFACGFAIAPTAFSNTGLAERASLYRARYGLENATDKRVNNRGEDDHNLYGTRNFREVLTGVLYRGGANNKYHRPNPRENSNPLPEDGLENLCKEGFERAIYLYATRFSTASPEKKCDSRISFSQNRLEYSQISSLVPENQKTLLKIIYENIKNPLAKPIYAHCWNGWHASGYLSALSLMQFCNWDSDRTVKYWNRNTDGAHEGKSYDKIRERIKNFKPIEELRITREEATLICPIAGF